VTSVEDGAVAVSPSTLFRIGSVTKPLVGTALMRLVESGRLELDRPVKDYVAWLRFSEPGVEERITVRMLMSHTAGLPTDSRRGNQELGSYVREQLPHYQLVAPPGRLFSYSNPGLNLLGYLAQVAAGQPFAALMRDLVFAPLEMERTIYDPAVALTYPVAQPHRLHTDGVLYVEHDMGDSIAYRPSGWAFSTALDLAHFAMLHLRQGRFRGRQLLTPNSIDEMHRRHADERTLLDSGYGLTFETTMRRGVRSVGHSGHLGNFRAWLILLPEPDLAFALLVNRTSGTEQLMSIVLDHLVRPSREPAGLLATEPEKACWPGFVGTYLGMRTGLAAIRVDQDQLVLDLNGMAIPLEAHDSHLYTGHRPGSEGSIGVEFLPEKAGPARYVRIDRWVCERRQPDSAFTPDPASWARYVGVYRGTVDPDIITVQLADDRLWLRWDAQEVEVPCTPLAATQFACDLGLAEFQLTEDGGQPRLMMLGVYPFDRQPPQE
jgi:CubicO group peptidase (beta-lactamase class C family)